MPTKKYLDRKRRHARIKAKISSSRKKPRLVVFRSLTHTYAQIIDDETGKILTSSSDLKMKKKGTKTDMAKEVGKEVAAKALEKKIGTVVFDRNGYKYHGRTKAVADGAREGGLTF